MRINVREGATGEVQIYELGDGSTGKDLKSLICERLGAPVEYQELHFQGNKVSGDAPLCSGEYEVSYTLVGGDPHCKLDDNFVCYFRCMCCFSGIDGDWRSCVWFCLKCGI
mmetsp:Transcript_35024/g.98770  ORF Transcript_35024/g.98770 Transcript_35024/m.98770 type:complete len:111 (+) Transcript_35024:24-356(+)